MEISIKSASEMVKVSRTTIYEKLKSGELAKCASGKIETSELLRVFGSPADRRTKQEEKEHIEQLKSTLDTGQKQDTFSKEKEELYKTQIKTLEEALAKAHEREHQHIEREQWQRNHIEKLTDTIKLLEPPKSEVQEKPKGFFSRLFRK
jgi:septal ring factor EnvC (AmiA/AmiB activator)